MDIYELAGALFGRSRAENASVNLLRDTTIYGTAEKSADGLVRVYLGDDVTQAEDDGLEHDAYVELPTEVAVMDGDEVAVTLSGGSMSNARVTGVVGGGDRMQAEIDDAFEAADAVRDLAEQAEAAARATSQHFWHDTDGAHVTQVTQDEWNDQTSTTTYHKGPNALWNAFGMLFRNAENNLLSVLTNGIAIYDGAGNAAENILALITSNLVRIGGRFATSGESRAGVQFFADDSSTSDLTASHYIDTEQDMQVYHNLMLKGTTTDAMLTGGTAIHSASGNVQTYQEVYNDGSSWSEEALTGMRASASSAIHYAEVAVNVLESSAGQLIRDFHVTADRVRLMRGTGTSTVSTIHDMADVQDALNGVFHLETSVRNVNDSGNTYFLTARTDTGHQLQFGIGGGGTNRGIWDLSSGAWLFNLDGNDRLHIPKWSMKRHDAQTSSAVSVANNANRSIVTLSVSGDEEDVVGMWLLIGHAKFATNTSGRRVAGVTTSANASLGITATNTVVTQPPTNGAETAMVLFDTFTINYGTTSWTRYLTVWQNSGSALNCEGSLKAVRIGMP